MYSILIRTTIMYILIMASIRLMGKKNLGEFQPSDLVSTMIISNLTSLVIEAPDLPLMYSVVPILLISCYEVFSSQLARKSSAYSKITQGSSKVLIHKGKIDQKVMSELRFTVEDVLECIREKDVFYLETVAVAIVETTGAVCVYTDDKVNIQKSSIPPFPIVVDGEIKRENFSYIGFDDKKLDKLIQKNNYNISQILLLLVDGDGKHNCIIKEDI